MALLEAPPIKSLSPNVLLHGVSWETYVKLRDETDVAGQRVYMTYDSGELEITPPLPIHDRIKMVVHDLVMLTCAERNIDIIAMGSTTYRRDAIARGIEPGNCILLAAPAPPAKRTSIRLGDRRLIWELKWTLPVAPLRASRFMQPWVCQNCGAIAPAG
jgi:hypothetical protein